MTIKIKTTVHVEAQQDQRAIVDDLQELERFGQSSFSFNYTQKALRRLFCTKCQSASHS